uniref:toll-like receptor 9 n=1 Tax=Nyctereutes procyonoides TaxID=34880 RepID=UPI002444431C|nr:toll-like receptor 9 [Nyctereutes procyonoides]
MIAAQASLVNVKVVGNRKMLTLEPTRLAVELGLGLPLTGPQGPCRGALHPLSLLVQAAALALALAQGTLPAFLPCELQPHGLVNCNWLFLKSVPRFSAAAPRGNVTSLSLYSNRIHHLHDYDFVHFVHLRRLNLKWNCPPASLSPMHFPCHMTIEPNTFLAVPTLEELNLSYNSITTVPALPSSLVSLSLSRTNILVLDPATLAGLYALRFLFLDGNCYYKNPCQQALQVAPGALLGLGNLTHLSLKYNNLTVVPRGLPPRLEYLLLSYNHIITLAPEDLANLTALRVLDVGGNCRRCDHARNPCRECPKGFPQLHPNTFSHLSRLEGLVLKDSSLYSLDPRWFHGLGNLMVLDLSENFLYDCITKTKAFYGLARLRRLNLSFNYHKKVSFAHLHLAPSFGSLLSLQELDIHGIFFRSLSETTLQSLAHLPMLQRLHLQLNFISQAQLSIFGAFPGLRYVDLSDNRISGAAEPVAATGEVEADCGERVWPQSRDLALGPLGTPGSEAFMPSCRTLNFTLDLSRNNLVTVQPEMFVRLARLQCLGLSHNSISQAVNGSQFVPLSNLQVLDLSHNKLDLYHGRSFTELPRLEALDLSYNSQPFSMRGVGHNLSFVAQLPALRYLSLAHNGIHSRVSQQLRSASLWALDFSGNTLSQMWAEGDLYLRFFQGLRSLVQLDLSQNRLHTLLPRNLDNLPKSLRLLRLRDNYLAFFNWSSLALLPKLEALDLAGNQLKALSNGSLPNGTQLQRLDLSGNSIGFVVPGFFALAMRLRELNLSANALKTVEPSWFGSLAGALKVLDVTANPLHCACGATFVDFLLEVQAAVPGLPSRVKCGSPGQLQGRSIFAQDLRLCLDEALSWVCFSLSLLAVALSLAVPMLHQLCGWDLWYCFHLCLAWLPRRGRRRGVDALAYDAFVVFDKAQSSVADWVYNELRVQLEERRGRRALRLCLEERDWVPGKTLFENLWASVYSSRKTLFVLARTDRVSGLLRASFLLAQQRLLEDRKDVVVLVILCPDAHRSRYVRLRQRLCRQSVLLWPHQPSGQRSFWAQLGTALTRDNRHFYNQNFCRGPTTA